MLSKHDRYHGLGMDALATALETRPLLWYLWFGHGCSGHRMLSKHERHHGIYMVWAWMLWSLYYALETRTLLRFEHGCSGHRMLSEHDRYCGIYGLGMDALVTECSRNRNVIMVFMVWAWMLWSPHALGTRPLLWHLWFGHGCSGHRMLSKQERHYGIYGLGMDALVTVCSRNTNVIKV